MDGELSESLSRCLIDVRLLFRWISDRKNDNNEGRKIKSYK